MKINKNYLLEELRKLQKITNDLFKEANKFNEELIEEKTKRGVKVKKVTDKSYCFYDLSGEKYCPNMAGVTYLYLQSVRNHIMWIKTTIEALIESFEKNIHMKECLEKRGWKWR